MGMACSKEYNKLRKECEEQKIKNNSLEDIIIKENNV